MQIYKDGIYFSRGDIQRLIGLDRSAYWPATAICSLTMAGEPTHFAVGAIEEAFSRGDQQIPEWVDALLALTNLCEKRFDHSCRPPIGEADLVAREDNHDLPF